MNQAGQSVLVENSLPECGHFYVLSRFFVFWWDIAGLPNTQLIIPLIIHNVGDYSDKNIQFPQWTHPITTLFLCLILSSSGSSNVSDAESLEKSSQQLFTVRSPPLGSVCPSPPVVTTSQLVKQVFHLFVHKSGKWFHEAWSWVSRRELSSPSPKTGENWQTQWSLHVGHTRKVARQFSVTRSWVALC